MPEKFAELNCTLERFSFKQTKSKLIANGEILIPFFDENPEFSIQNGRWGPFLKAGKKNVRLPKDLEDPAKLTYEECVEMAENYVPGRKKGKAKK